MKLHQRLSRGLISSLAARGVAIASQLVTIPVLARAWGVQVYGEYLTMVALASYVGIATLGVHQAALAEMAMTHARGDGKGYGNALRGLFQTVSAVGAAALAVQVGLAFFTPTRALLHQGAGGHYSAGWAIFLIGAQYILLQQLGIVTNAIAALGRYGEAQGFDTVRAAVDACGLWVGVLLFRLGPDKAALISVIISVTTIGAAWLRLGAVAPVPLRLFGRVDWRRFASLWKPTIGNFAITALFQTLLVQAPRLILASVAGGAAVALFSIIWALMGVIRQSFEVLLHPLNVEFAFAFSSEEKTLATDLLALGTTAATGVTALACLPVIVLGPWIIGLATKGQIHAPYLLVAMLWGVLALYSASICFQAALQSSNQSYRALWPLMGLSAAFLALAYGLARAYGPYGLAGALWFYQLGVAVVIVRRTCRAFGIPLAAILGEALSFGSLKRVLAMLMAPLRKAAPAGSAA